MRLLSYTASSPMSPRPSQSSRRKLPVASSRFIAEGPTHASQMIFLQAVPRCVPQRMQSLEGLALGDDEGLRGWACAYELTAAPPPRTEKARVAIGRDAPELRGRRVSVSGAAWVPEDAR